MTGTDEFKCRKRGNEMSEKLVFASIGMDHGHIYGMTDGLLGAGAVMKWAYDPDSEKLEAFVKKYENTGVMAAESIDQILADPEVELVATACVPGDRAELGIRTMEAGKDYFVDKAPVISLEQLDAMKEVIARTGRKYFVNYSERLHSEAAVFAEQLIKEGKIGRVLQVLGMGPHRIGKPRPDWFYDRSRSGGILIDIGSHQIEQFLFFTGAKDATISSSHIANYNHPQTPDWDDYGDVSLVADNGATCYFRVDWFTPDGLTNWGDGRTFILGTEGYIEMRKFVNITDNSGAPKMGHVFWVDKEGEHYENVHGKMGYPYFARLIADCKNRTDTAMDLEHALKAAELSVKAQMQAKKVAG